MFTVLALGFVGCAYSYVPTAHTGLQNNERGVTYALPSDNPRGSLRVRAVGVESPKDSPSLHMRMIVDNSSAEPWAVDPAAQRVRLPAGQEINAVESGHVIVPPGATERVDLHFPLPPGERAGKLPRFVAVSNVVVDGQPLSERTPFVRTEQGPTMPCGAHADQYCLSGYAGGG